MLSNNNSFTAPLTINLFGAPSSGKSTCASMLFTKLKMARVNVELITEYAKEKTWEENNIALDNQAYIFGCQSYRLGRIRDKVDVIITDSPLPLSILYNRDPILGEDFNKVVMNVFNSYDNVNYFLLRATKYDTNGRNQTEEESDILCEKLQNLLKERKVPYIIRRGCEGDYVEIANEVLELCKKRNLVQNAMSITPD